MNERSYKILPLRREHVTRAVDLHLNAFPGFFLSFLGPSFLAEFYRAFTEEEDALAFVSEDKSGKLLGVIVGTLKPNGFFRKLLRRRWLAFSLASTRAILGCPAIIWRLVQAVRYRGDPPSDRLRALLSSIAVAPQCQNLGVGSALLSVWIEAVRQRGCSGGYLITDALDNETVNVFYKRNGWLLMDSFQTPQGRQMNRYVWDFPSVNTVS